MPLLIKALHYDERRGAHSRGSNVRDAACYVSWALARAYDPHLLADHFRVALASALLITAVFDREINCRRAAAAAFQEHVGRQGSFPHGIEIIQIANYFTLVKRTDSYLKIAPQIATYDEYRKPLITHLIENKIQHWDQSIRELSAHALNHLTAIEPNWMISDVIPFLLPKTLSSDLLLRHGSILSIAEILFGVAEYNKERKDAQRVSLPRSLQCQIIDIAPAVDRARLYRGRGAEFIRFAVCKLLEAIATLQFSLNLNENERKQLATGSALRSAERPPIPRKEKGHLQLYLETLEENLKHPQHFVQEAAVQTLATIWKQYPFHFESPTASKSVITTYIKVLSSELNPAARRGYALALGHLTPSVFFRSSPTYLEDVVNVLIKKTEIEKDPEQRDAETRRNAVRALTQLIKDIEFSDTGLNKTLSHRIFDAFLKALEDYATDNRGDVGSWVREAALVGLDTLTRLLVLRDSNSRDITEKWFLPEMCQSLMCKILKQMVEKLDRVRDLSGRVFEGLIRSPNHTVQQQQRPTETSCHHLFRYHQSNFNDTLAPIGCISCGVIPHIPHHQEILTLLNSCQEAINWSQSQRTFKILTPLLQFDVYRKSLLSGIICSIGGVTNNKNLVQDSSSALLDYLRAISTQHDQQKMKENTSDLEKFANTIIEIFKENAKDDRIVVPLLRCLEMLVSSDIFVPLRSVRYCFGRELLQLTSNSIKQTKDVNKLMAAAKIFCGLLLFDEPVRKQSLEHLLYLLGHSYPKIRKVTAEQFYVQLETSSQILDEKQTEQVKNILLTTPWGSSFEFCIVHWDKLYEFFGIPKPPQANMLGKDPKQSEHSDSDFTYEDLVREKGF
jgi:hypothetical protein